MWSVLRTWITADSLGMAVFLASYLGYPLYGHLTGHGSGARRRLSVLRDLRATTARNVSGAEGRALLAASFQAHGRTLVFLGTTALLALGGALGLLLNPQKAGQLCASSVFAEGTSQPDVLRIRMVMFSLMAGYAFLQFVWGLKALYHLSFAVQTCDPARVAPFLEQLDQDFSRGVRTLYYLSVLFLWFFGPEFLLVGSMLLTVSLWHFDTRQLVL